MTATNPHRQDPRSGIFFSFVLGLMGHEQAFDLVQRAGEAKDSNEYARNCGVLWGSHLAELEALQTEHDAKEQRRQAVLRARHERHIENTREALGQRLNGGRNGSDSGQ